MIDDGAGKHRFGPSVIKKLEGICQYACDLTGVEHSGFVGFDDNQEVGEVIAQHPDKPALLHRRITLKGVPAEQELLRSEVPLVVPDVASATHLSKIRSLLMEFDIRSICIVKVRLHGKVIGSFSFDSIGKKRDFTTKDIDLCRSFAVLASSEIEQTLEAEWVKDFQLATLAINVEEEAPLLKAIIKQAEVLFKAQTAGLYLRRPDANGEDSLQLVASSTEELTGKTLRKGEGMAWQLIFSLEPYMFTSDYDKYDYRANFFEGTFGSVLEVPLLRQDERIGVLYLSDKKGRTFNDLDAKHLQQYADSAVIAIQHCNLVTRMKDISIASAEMFGGKESESRSSRLTQIAQKATTIMNAEMCGVFFRNESGILVLEASSGHRPEVSNLGRSFEIKEERGSGLTGALAARFIAMHAKHISETSPGTKAERPVIDLCGESLLHHPAVKGGELDATPGGYAILCWRFR